MAGADFSRARRIMRPSVTLEPGAYLGPYEILAAIGRGGMGEVYRARDTRLKREIAIKVLPAHVTNQANKRQRFEREAQAVAALSHPHICAVFDVGSHEGTEFLVMEHLEGETLERRLLRGALPLDQVQRHAIEIAGALDHAHRHGIVHRDLKPANIMLTKSGAKLLDFGLAKWSEREPVQIREGTEAAGLPETRTLTAQGTILGTLQYMAPEQLESKETDGRADLFALGAIVYEMTTGRRAFAGASHASVIAAILTAEPAPMASVNPLVSPSLERTVRKCLAKDPDLRWQTARDLLDELKWTADTGSLDVLLPSGSGAQPLALPGRQRGRRAPIAWLAAGAVAVTAAIVTAVLAFNPFLRGPTERPGFQFTISAPEGWILNEASPFTALSPDGRSLVFTATSRTGERAVWLRSLDSGAARQITGSEGGTQPFWSPDNQFIFFRTEQGWRRVDSAGGPGQGIGAVDGAAYGTVNRDGVVIFMIEQKIFQAVPKGLYRISSTLVPTAVTTPDETRKEIAHEWPQFLPDGRHFLYVTRAGHPDHDGVVNIGSLDSADRVRLFKADSQAVYAPPGFLVYLRGNTLVAQPFDADALRVTGEPVRIAEKVDRDGASRRGAFSVSQNGVLAYHPASETQLVWFDRGGGSLKAIAAGTNPAISPDERQVVVTRREGDGRTSSLWLINLADGNASGFTSGPLSDDMPLWSRDGRHIVFKAMREHGPGIFQKSASGAGAEGVVLAPQGTLSAPAQFGVLQPFIHPLAWSGDGRFLIYAKSRPLTTAAGIPQTTLDLWMVPLDGNRKPVPLSQADLESDPPEWGGQISPDGRWLAYVSIETGRHEVYVRSFPSGDGRWKVSPDGGYEPVWRRDGKELFYLAYDRHLMAVAVRSEPAFSLGTPSRVLRTRVSPPAWAITRNQYAVSADGQRFLVRGVPSLPITVVTNWTTALKKP
jgi:hypothetical protein